MVRELEILEIAENLIAKNKLEHIKIQFKNVRKGRARYRTRKITMPIWALQGVKEYAYYYIIHEITHFILRDMDYFSGHGSNFMGTEKNILEEYGIIPKYAKAYAKALYNLEGKKLCNGLGENNDK